MTPGFQLEHRCTRWLLITGLLILVGLLNAGVWVTGSLSWSGPLEIAEPLITELNGALCLLPLLPAVFWLIVHYPIQRSNALRRVPLHLGASVAMGISHTLLLLGTRAVMWPLLGWGTYDLGRVGYRFLFEYQKQFIAYIIVYVIVTVALYVRHNRHRELERERLEKQLIEARLDALKTQLNPHFLFNTLHMISSLIDDDPGRAEDMIARLSDFLRLTLRHAKEHEVPLSRELDLLEPYLDIMQTRFEERLAVTVDIEPETRCALVPQLFLQPLVENAIKHTAAGHPRRGEIRIRAERRGDELVVSVEDSGPGPDSAETASGEGIGLANTRARLAELHGARASLDLASRPEGGCRADLRIPLHYREDRR